MSIISAAALFPRDVPTSPFAGSSDTLPASANSSHASWGHHGHRDPATHVDLSDKVKGILARAGTDQDAADRLKAFVQAHRINNGDGSARDNSSSGQDSSTDINQTFEQLSGGSPATGASQGFDETNSGNSATLSSFSNLEASVAVQAYRRGSKEYITFSESEVAATGVAASSDAGAVSATSTGTHTASLTFAIDFKTGAISIATSESTSVSTAVQIAQPNSSFSTFA